MAFFIIIRGPLGVGKTTVAERLAKRLGAKHVSVDSVLEKHGLDKAAEDTGCIPVENFMNADDLIFPEMKETLGKGKAVIFDGCFYHKGHIAHIIDNLAYRGFVFTLNASLKTCIERDRERAKPYGEDAAGAVHSLVSRFDMGTIIDTEGKTIEDVTGEIYAYLQKQIRFVD